MINFMFFVMCSLGCGYVKLIINLILISRLLLSFSDFEMVYIDKFVLWSLLEDC